ncbi:MAG: O-antigen ligase family protein [Saprospiraceae bacterium]|nr:O-antigen ligase family protein [Saprospiraceae bacterium]
MILLEGENSRRDLFFIILIVLLTWIGFWNSVVVLPILILGVPGLALAFNKNSGSLLKFDPIDLLLLALLGIEFFTYFFSIYRPNSFLSVEKMFFWVLFYYLLRLGLRNSISRNVLLTSLGILGLLLSFGSIISFFLLKANLEAEGWLDASQFKALFSPFGFRNNDWATLALCFLPFPLIVGVLFRSAKYPVWIGLLCFSLVVFSVLISFSRGAYLSLVVFGSVLTTGFIFFRLVKLKTLFLPVIATIGILALMLVPIYEPFKSTMAMNKTVSQQRSTKGRLETFQLAWCKVKDHWWPGAGAYNYALSRNHCYPVNEDAGYHVFTNNLYLQILIEKGLLGLIIYSLLFLVILWRFFIRLSRDTNTQERIVYLLLFAGFITYCFRELFFSSFFENNPVMVMTCVYAGLSPVTGTPWSMDKGSRFIKGMIRYLPMVLILCVGAWIHFEKWRYHKAEQVMNESVILWEQGSIPAAKDRMDRALKLAPGNAPYHELAGLISGSVNEKMDSLFSAPAIDDPASFTAALSHFKKALELNPYDGGFHFNLACLLFLQDPAKTKLPGNHFQKALYAEPNNIEFLIGYGLSAEYSGDTSLAYGLYEKAIRLDPELLESEFFEDLSYRRPALSGLLIEKAIFHLKNSIDTGYNSVFAARLGLLFWSASQSSEAKKLFSRVVQELPDLYRPYYYLSRIAEAEGDSALAQRLLRKSLYLNHQDYLAPLAMGDYYYLRMGAHKNIAYSVTRYYMTGLSNLLKFPTIHRYLAGLQYKSDISCTNDLIFKNLVPYTRMKIDFNKKALRMAEVYNKTGNSEMEAYYLKLASRDLDDLNIEELK